MAGEPAGLPAGAHGLALLDRSTLARLPARLRPSLAPSALSVGIVHLGAGAFHRAHLVVYTERAAELAGEERWGLLSASQRSPRAAELLRAQDCLYSVRAVAPGRCSIKVLASLREALFAGEAPERVVGRIAEGAVSLVTLTVTEKGYRHDPATGHLARKDPELLADALGRPPRTVLGQLARGLEARRRAGTGPVAVCSCDNLVGNGALLRRLVSELVALAPGGFDAGLDGWIRENVTFPSSVVDRIVPAATPADVEESAALLGVEDRAAVVAEPFSQWVIEDDFLAPRPRWELAGAELVTDVSAHEELKLRVLNGSHSSLAYLGALAGLGTVAEAAGEPRLEAFVRRLVLEEVAPTLSLPPGVELAGYLDAVLERFANPALRYTCLQVASDGSLKLGPRLLGTVRDRLAQGAEPRRAALVVAAWAIALARGVDDLGRPLVVLDPLAARVAELLGSPGGAGASAARLLGLLEVFGEDLGEDDRFRRLLADGLEALSAAPALEVAALAAG